MMRSLYSGISGLKTHQTRMDLIGNNIANVNTVAFKSSSASFSDLMYQTSQRASGPNAETGIAGQNAKQIGLGVRMGAIKTNITTPGSSQTTGDPWDLKINGDAFFIVSQGGSGPMSFTRDGSLYVDAAGNLAMASTGYNVMGWQPDPDNPNTAKPDRVSALRIMSAVNMTYSADATTKAYAAGIIDSNDETVQSTAGRTMNLTFYDQKGYSYTAKFSFHQVYNTATPPVAVDGQFRLQLDDVINSENESLTDVYGVTGLHNIVTMAGGDAVMNAGPPPVQISTSMIVQYDTGTGKFNTVDAAGNIGGGANPLSAFTLDFAAAYTNFKDIEVDMSNTKNVDNEGTCTVAAKSGASGTGADALGVGAGRKEGALSGISIDVDGRIWASYDNNQTRLLGQIAVATFPNAAGLEKMGDNLYQATMNSGEFDGVGVDVTADEGSISTGVLEMSNVDLSSEFTEMITTQRGFQANSRIITVSDTLLEELVNLKR